MGGRTEPTTDEELVQRIRDGDASAAATLFDRHLPDLRARARRRLPGAIRGRVAESDVIQDAYLAAFQSISRFEDRGEGSFGAWLRRILDHRVLAEVERHLEAGRRDARREIRIDTRGHVLGPDRDQVSPSGEIAAAEEAARLGAAVARLAPDHRDVIRLVHEESLTLVQAAERMGRSPDAVRKLYGRALARLSEILAKDGGGPP